MDWGALGVHPTTMELRGSLVEELHLLSTYSDRMIVLFKMHDLT